jgi:hypothetical protein
VISASYKACRRRNRILAISTISNPLNKGPLFFDAHCDKKKIVHSHVGKSRKEKGGESACGGKPFSSRQHANLLYSHAVLSIPVLLPGWIRRDASTGTADSPATR